MGEGVGETSGKATGQATGKGEGRTTMDEFREYKYVIRHTRDLALLKELHRVKLTKQQATGLVEKLIAELGLPPVTVSYTMRGTVEGRYHRREQRINLHVTNRDAEIVAHEVTHHRVAHLTGGGRVPYHSVDFVFWLDEIAIITRRLITDLDRST